MGGSDNEMEDYGFAYRHVFISFSLQASIEDNVIILL